MKRIITNVTSSMIFHLICFGLFGYLLVGCQNTKPLPVEIARTLNPPPAMYLSVAWLDEQTIVLLHQPTDVDESEGSALDGMATYNIDTEAWLEIPMPEPTRECSPVASRVGFLTRLPDSNLGFTYTCLSSKGISGTLYLWDRDDNSLEMVHDYPIPFSATAFTFSPDMKEFIQENAEGFGLNENLFRGSQDGDLQQLFINFQRVRAPSWSLDGDTIAFAGTETYPGGDSGDFTEWGQIEGLLDYPWDIYLMEADGSNVRIIK